MYRLGRAPSAGTVQDITEQVWRRHFYHTRREHGLDTISFNTRAGNLVHCIPIALRRGGSLYLTLHGLVTH